MNMPIVEGLRKYVEEKNVRLHMPGHKGKNSLLNWDKYIPNIDVTEVYGTDNLHNPNSIIKKSQELAAEAFGAKKTFYSVNGTTVGIYAAILAVTRLGDKVLVQRNCHRSVYNALIFGRLKPRYIYPAYNSKDNIITGLNPQYIEEMLKRDKDIKVVIITYPSYYGICSDIKRIADIVHKYNKILIVDEAHGSHLKFNDKLPISALEAGADITIQSTHKTLPAFTQSSMIHIGTDRVNSERLRAMVSMYQTTSPSYILMASLDMARAYMERRGREELEYLIEKITEITSYLKQIDGVKIFDKDNLDDSFYDFDITKILINLTDINITGNRLEKILREQYNIQVEMSDFYYSLALMTALDRDEDLEKLCYAIEDISKKEVNRISENTDIDIKYIKPDIVMPLDEAFHRENEIIPLSECENKISGDFIIPYPPGIPILCPGERVTGEIINYINLLKKDNVQILGLLDYNSIKALR